MTEDDVSVPKPREVVATTEGAAPARRRRHTKSNRFHVSRKNRQLSRNLLLMGLFVLLILIVWYEMISRPPI